MQAQSWGAERGWGEGAGQDRLACDFPLPQPLSRLRERGARQRVRFVGNPQPTCGRGAGREGNKQAHAVAGAVKPLAGRKRMRHEALGSQAGAAVIAARKSRTGQIQLTNRAGRHRIERIVEHPGTSVRQRRADRHAGRTRRIGQRRMLRQDADSRFGRTVVVDYRKFGAQRTNFVNQRPWQGFAAEDQRDARQRAGRRSRVQHPLQVTRHDLQHTDLVLGHIGGEAVRVERALG